MILLVFRQQRQALCTVALLPRGGRCGSVGGQIQLVHSGRLELVALVSVERRDRLAVHDRLSGLALQTGDPDRDRGVVGSSVLHHQL